MSILLLTCVAVFAGEVTPVEFSEASHFGDYTGDAGGKSGHYTLTSGNFRLVTDITFNNAYLLIPENESVVIDLNGYKINRAISSNVDDNFVFDVRGSLVMTDGSESAQGSVDFSADIPELSGSVPAVVKVEEGGTLTLEGGTIYGNQESQNPVVSVEGTFNMKGGCISTAEYGVKAYPEATVNLSGGSFADISNCSLSLTASTAYISGLVDAAICLGEEASLNVSGPLTEGSKISLVETYLSYGQSVDIAPESEYITEKTPGYFSSPDGYEIYAENGGLKMKNNFGEPVFDASTGVLTLSGKVDVKKLYMYILLKKWIVKSIVCKKGTVFPKNSAKAFAGLTNLESIDLSKADMSQITDMTAMFAGDVKLKTIIVGTQ